MYGSFYRGQIGNSNVLSLRGAVKPNMEHVTISDTTIGALGHIMVFFGSAP